MFTILPDTPDACREACWGPDTPHLTRQACHLLLTGEGVWSGVPGRAATRLRLSWLTRLRNVATSLDNIGETPDRLKKLPEFKKHPSGGGGSGKIEGTPATHATSGGGGGV